MLEINKEIRIPLREFHFSFVRSSGPGGQNVNKVATKAVLRWNVHKSGSLPEEVRERFTKRYANRINQEGELIVSSSRFRDQGRNTADCLEKLRSWLQKAAEKPRPRRPTKPSRAARERRLKEKRFQSQKKEGRRKLDT